MATRIGFIGLGIMGEPMAGHLLAAGNHVWIHTRTRAKAARLLTAGATWCDSPAETARHCDVLFTVLPDTPDVEAVLFGEKGAAGALRPGSVVIDSSTIDPGAARVFQQRLAECGVAMLDAPITGGQIGAQQASLTIMVGGEAATFERVRPLLECLGKRVFRVGPPGAGQTLKACNQVLCVGALIGVCEALELAARGGIEPRHVVEGLAGGAGGSWTLEKLGGKIVAGDLMPAFMVKLMQKDLEIVQRLARAVHLPLPGTALAQQLLRSVEAEPGGGELGTQAMVRAYRRLAAT